MGSHGSHMRRVLKSTAENVTLLAILNSSGIDGLNFTLNTALSHSQSSSSDSYVNDTWEIFCFGNVILIVFVPTSTRQPRSPSGSRRNTTDPLCLEFTTRFTPSCTELQGFVGTPQAVFCTVDDRLLGSGSVALPT